MMARRPPSSRRSTRSWPRSAWTCRPLHRGAGRLGSMTNTNADPTLDRLLRHMAWANAELVARLAGEPVETLALTAPCNEWSAGRILAHLLNAAQGYASRMEGVERPANVEPPTSATELADLGARLAATDASLRGQAIEP